jgi:hypothetical protein
MLSSHFEGVMEYGPWTLISYVKYFALRTPEMLGEVFIIYGTKKDHKV